MTEAEWLTSTEPEDMLPLAARQGASTRKLRLFACACCWKVLQVVPHRRCEATILIAERYSDGYADEDEVRAADSVLDRDTTIDWPVRFCLHFACHTDRSGFDVAWGVSAYAADAFATVPNKEDDPAVHVRWSPRWGTARATQAAILREIIGNLFQPVSIEPGWQTPTLTSLALAAYEHRDLTSGVLELDRLAVLSDPLEEAGCTDAEILDHLRSPGPHVRGCWALDLVLGKF